MLKKCYGLFLGLVVLAGSACVTPTHASSASIVISNIRAGSSASALEEGVVLYNNSSIGVVIDGWCIANKLQISFACIEPELNEQIILPAYSYATIVSKDAASHTPLAEYAAIYEPSNLSSGAIVASSDTISLLNVNKEIIDQYSWSSSISSSQQWARLSLGLLPAIFLDTDTASDWQKISFSGFPISQVEYRLVLDDGPEVPEEPPLEPNEPIESENPPASPLLPIITEIFPNAVGSDTGNEFIEIYNPSETTDISLAGYKLLIGPSLEKVIALNNYTLKPGEYKMFTNTEYAYSLLNTSSKIALMSPEGAIVSETPAYDAPKEGRSWVLINGSWHYTSTPTPGGANQLAEEVVESESEDSTTSTQKPCAANQVRNSETNRCRLVSSAASSSPSACKEGQERNPETNRCRAIASTSTGTPCKEGQERNPETNRCRNIKQLTKTNFAVKGATTKQQGGMGWYMWAAIAGIVCLVIGYAVWEWREELKKFYKHMKVKFAGSKN